MRKPIMRRFIYNANAFAMGGRLTRPIEYTLETAAPVVLPDVGGKAAAKARQFTLKAPDGNLLIAWESVETSVAGGEERCEYVTETSSTVRGLNVCDVLKIDEMIMRLVVRYNKATRKSVFEPAGSTFKGVDVGGKTFDITIDGKMCREGSDFEKFRAEHPDFPFSGGKVYYSLARNPDLIFEGDENGMLLQPGFGKIYFGEWSVGPGVQNFKMLRLELGSEDALTRDDPPPAGGGLDGGGGGSNGQTYP